jgi:hypothetical protein
LSAVPLVRSAKPDRHIVVTIAPALGAGPSVGDSLSIDQTGDEAGAVGPVDGAVESHSLDRRSLIKKAGVAGAAAWVAPMVIGSVMSPASAVSIPPGTYALRLSTTRCNANPVLDPRGAPPPPNCTPLLTDFPNTDFTIANGNQLAALGITVSNCNPAYWIQVTSSSNPKVTFTEAGATSSAAGANHACLPPVTLTTTQVTWKKNLQVSPQGFFIIVNLAP